MLRIIDFAPPIQGMENEFNTFRLGRAWAKRVQAGDKVGLMDAKERALLGWAIVVGVHVGKLDDLAARLGRFNHNQKHQPIEGAAGRLCEAMIKIYGPHKCSYHSICTVIELRRIDDD